MTLKHRLISTIAIATLIPACTLLNTPQKQEVIIEEASQVSQPVVAPAAQIEAIAPNDSDLIAETAKEPETTVDLWQYIQQKQQLTSIHHPKIKQFEKYFLKHAHYLKKKTDKAAPYLYYIIQELEKRQMPLELAFTPMVESNFDPLAHSVVQAAGLWQFMPRTAKGFGLEINDWYDGRRDVVASTHAALSYYQYLNKMFKGDWLLTVAAYNYGEGNVLKAIKKNKKLIRQ